MKAYLFLFLAACSGTYSMAQYAPQAGVPGSTAISASSSLFTGWATQCTIARGYLNIDSPALGPVTSGDSSLALGAPDMAIVSLGDSGVATLSFSSPVYNGDGPDFAVFENGFPNPLNDSQAFLELAFVEVSTDGNRYVRFPARSLTPLNVQIPAAGVYMYANLLDNLAGKYIGKYGTPFDLQELVDSPGIDINNINYVRVVDVIGTIGNHASHDIAGNIINDPYPTQFATGGFDLDAVGAIHQLNHTGVTTLANNISVKTYPNPVTDKLIVSVNGPIDGSIHAIITTITGRQLARRELSQSANEIPVAQLPAGMYYLVLLDANGNKWVEKFSKY